MLSFYIFIIPLAYTQLYTSNIHTFVKRELFVIVFLVYRYSPIYTCIYWQKLENTDNACDAAMMMAPKKLIKAAARRACRRTSSATPRGTYHQRRTASMNRRHSSSSLRVKRERTRSVESIDLGLIAASAALLVSAAAAVGEAESRSNAKQNLGSSYELFQTLGEGTFGKVKLAKSRQTGEKVAIKEMDKRQVKSFRREVEALKRIHAVGGHINISGLNDIYQDSNNYYLVMELISGGELFDRLINYGAYSEHMAAELILEAAIAINFLHHHSIIHADIKPENIMLSSSSSKEAIIKVVDMGCALMDGEIPDSKSTIGTSAYWSPELFKAGDNSAWSPAADIWALGCVLYIMLSGRHPFDLEGDADDAKVRRNILNNEINFDPYMVGRISRPARSLIRRMLEKDPRKRITAEELIRDRWITGEAASKEVLSDSGERLEKFKALRHKLKAGIFAVMIHSNEHATGGEDESAADNKIGDASGALGIIQAAFKKFDTHHRGYISKEDLGRVLSEVTGTELSESEKEALVEAAGSAKHGGIDMNEYESIMGSLKKTVLKRGDFVFREGDQGETFYFINKGRVQVETNSGAVLATLKAGDFFGEGSLLSKEPRSASVKVITASADLIALGREEFSLMRNEALQADDDIRHIDFARNLHRFKALLKTMSRLVKHDLQLGEVLFREGSHGASCFVCKSGELAVTTGEQRIATLHPGDVFGETALLRHQPRNATVTCDVAGGCQVLEIMGNDFQRILSESPAIKASMEMLMRKRMFRSMVRKASGKQARASSMSREELKGVFERFDKDGSGKISLEELRNALRHVNPGISEEDLQGYMRTLAGTHEITFEEFCWAFEG